MGDSPLRIGLVGYGEVGQIVGQALKRQGVAEVAAWDVKLDRPEQAAALQSCAQTSGVVLCRDAAELLDRSDLVISAVTASQALAVAREAAGLIRPGTWFLDLNSASPGTRHQSASLIDSAGGRFVEAGVMTSVPPHGIRVPMLLGGPHAAALAPRLIAWGMNVQVVSGELGVASATKMCRSILIKGLEALVLESYTTARHYGVEDAMIATLQETFPGIDWTVQGSYFFSRVAQHGRRRAEEMREVARTVEEAGFRPFMAAAIAEKHDWMAAQSGAGHVPADGRRDPWQTYADGLLRGR